MQKSVEDTRNLKINRQSTKKLTANENTGTHDLTEEEAVGRVDTN